MQDSLAFTCEGSVVRLGPLFLILNRPGVETRLTATCYLKSLNCFSYRVQVSIRSNDFIPKLDIARFDHSHHDCVVQCYGEIAVKRLLSAFCLEVSEVHVW